MALILSIETSTQMCSASLSRDGEVILSKQHFDGYSHASHLTVLIESLIAEAGTGLAAIDAMAVSSGPGSYTGLRIGISTAKGICYALNKPMIAINSLEVLAWQMQQIQGLATSPSSWLCPMIDARRMEVYTSFFDLEMHSQSEIVAEIITEQSFLNILDTRQVIFAGNGADKCTETIIHPNAVFIANCNPLAHDMAKPAFKAYQSGRFEDVAYMEPFYLKDFVATTPKNKVL